MDERVVTCALPLLPLLLTQGLQSPVESVRTPVLATISRLVQLPSAPSLLLRSTASASESGAVALAAAGDHSSSEAGAGAGSTLLEQLVIACLGALEGFEAGSEAVQALNEATMKLEGAAERARLGAARSSLIRAHPAMDVIKRALLLLVASIADDPATRTALAGSIVGTLMHRIGALLRQPACSTACRFHFLLYSIRFTLTVRARVQVQYSTTINLREHTLLYSYTVLYYYIVQVLYCPVSRRCNFNLIR